MVVLILIAFIGKVENVEKDLPTIKIFMTNFFDLFFYDHRMFSQPTNLLTNNLAPYLPKSFPTPQPLLGSSSTPNNSLAGLTKRFKSNNTSSPITSPINHSKWSSTNGLTQLNGLPQQTLVVGKFLLKHVT